MEEPENIMVADAQQLREAALGNALLLEDLRQYEPGHLCSKDSLARSRPAASQQMRGEGACILNDYLALGRCI
jgi:hypothetical protein